MNKVEDSTTEALGLAPTASEHAYDHVRNLILDGALPGGTMISEGSVATELGVSRTPVREAFLRLQGEGWLQLYPKRGALVLNVAPGEREDIVTARILLETNAARQVAPEKASREALSAELDGILERQHTAATDDDLSAFAVADADFHTAIVAAGRNSLLLDFFHTLNDRQRRMTARSLWRRQDRIDAVLADHADLSTLIKNGNVDGFEQALTAHIRQTHQDLLS